MAATIEFLINVFGILVGIIAAWVVFAQGQSLGGRVGSAITLFIWGVIFQVLAFAYTIGVSNLALKEVLTVGGVNLHHAFMGVGMIFFLFSARKFMSLGGK